MRPSNTDASAVIFLPSDFNTLVRLFPFTAVSPMGVTAAGPGLRIVRGELSAICAPAVTELIRSAAATAISVKRFLFICRLSFFLINTVISLFLLLYPFTLLPHSIKTSIRVLPFYSLYPFTFSPRSGKTVTVISQFSLHYFPSSLYTCLWVEFRCRSRV